MNRLFLVILAILCLSLKSDGEVAKKVTCSWDGIEIDSQGCVNLGWYKIGLQQNCSNMPDCFKLQIEEVPKEEPVKEKPKKKEFFAKEDSEEKKKIIPSEKSSKYFCFINIVHLKYEKSISLRYYE